MRFFKGLIIGGFISLIMWLAFFALLDVARGGTNTGPIKVRWCPEDAVHVGWGDFDGARWEHYKCIPRDDIVPGGFSA